ncbi:MAG: hypothetical protein ACLPUT_09920 [Solirubrobacteraceae bacterium]
MISSTTEGVPDPLMLAAIDRAERHGPAVPPGVPIWGVYEHLAVARRSGPARRVRAQLETLEGAGSVERSRRHGVATWRLTSAGRRRLARALRAGKVPELPESPQHRKWREARTLAEHEIARFQGAVERDALVLAELLRGGNAETLSDEWFALAERLSGSLRLLGSATYCLWEWAEPDDARPDIDERSGSPDEGLDDGERARRRRRVGRRNVQLWQEAGRVEACAAGVGVDLGTERVEHRITVPDDCAGVLLESLLEALREAAQAFDDCRGPDPAFYCERAVRFERIRAALDALGWGEHDTAEIDVDDHRQVLQLALAERLATERESIADADRDATARGAREQRERACSYALAIERFMRDAGLHVPGAGAER